MPRYTKQYTHADLEAALIKANIIIPGEDYPDLRNYIETHSVFRKDIEKIAADDENLDLTDYYNNPRHSIDYFTTPKGIVYVLGTRHGDWEEPVHYAIYLDPTATLRAYIPSQGNTYDTINKCAFGNNDFEDEQNTLAATFGLDPDSPNGAYSYEGPDLGKLLGLDEIDFAKFNADIDNRIQFK